MNPEDQGLPAEGIEGTPPELVRGNPRQTNSEAFGSEWFAVEDLQTGETGLRFGCTMCGNCCSGPEGYVLVSDAEAELLARELGVELSRFLSEYTLQTREGRSLSERETAHGKDCIFLDRTSVPGRAICGVYEARPAQCRTWPFWPSVVANENAWRLAGRVCPGIGKGNLHPPQQIRIQRDAFRI
jgi:uncharacterized protein